jgi:hypothetical protein
VERDGKDSISGAYRYDRMEARSSRAPMASPILVMSASGRANIEITDHRRVRQVRGGVTRREKPGELPDHDALICAGLRE